MRKLFELVALGSLVIGLAGCSSSLPSATGNLSVVYSQSGELSQSSDQTNRKSIGEISINDPGSGVWDEPNGVTVGRVKKGSYLVYSVKDNWYQIGISNTHLVYNSKDDQYQIGTNDLLVWVPSSVGTLKASYTKEPMSE